MKSFEEECEDTLKEFPDFKIVAKSTSRLMSAIAVALRIVSFGAMSTFATRFTTTIGNTIYTPSVWGSFEDHQRVGILRHERIHMRQNRRMGSLQFKAYYLFWFFPVVFALGRAKLEMEAYEESMRCTAAYFGIEVLHRSSYRNQMVGHFTGPEYIWMWPFQKSVERWYDGVVSELQKEFGSSV